MAQLTLADLMSFVQDSIPDRPQAKIARAANRVLRNIHERIGVPKRSTLTTKPKVTTGTVSATIDSASVTFDSSVLGASDPFTIVQISGVDEWFNVTRVNGTTGTLSSVWPTTTASGLAFTLVYPIVTFPVNVLRVTRMWQEGWKELMFAGDEKQNAPVGWYSAPGITAGRVSPGRPLWWAPFQMDSSAASPSDDLVRRMLIPWPDQRYVFEYSYLERVAYFTPGGATSQTTGLPDEWNDAIEVGTLYWSWIQENRRENAEPWRIDYEKAMMRTLATQAPVSRLGDGGQDAGVWIEESWPVGG